MTNPINRISWIFVFAIAGYILCAGFAWGYTAGQKYELKRLATPVITEYGLKRYDPNIDPKYADLIKQGYSWHGGCGWQKK